ncbi:MAG: hypothetical protein F6K39_44770 [Okeania sp. SIO3B3]|nr:hypothetical protein [Okeania sp. SIO3B3]
MKFQTRVGYLLIVKIPANLLLCYRKIVGMPLPFLTIPYKELLKTLWGVWGVWGAKILSTVIKKMYFSIHFSPEKATPRPKHNLSIMSRFYVKKDVYKA